MAAPTPAIQKRDIKTANVYAEPETRWSSAASRGDDFSPESSLAGSKSISVAETGTLLGSEGAVAVFSFALDAFERSDACCGVANSRAALETCCSRSSNDFSSREKSVPWELPLVLPCERSFLWPAGSFAIPLLPHFVCTRFAAMTQPDKQIKPSCLSQLKLAIASCKTYQCCVLPHFCRFNNEMKAFVHRQKCHNSTWEKYAHH